MSVVCPRCGQSCFLAKVEGREKKLALDVTPNIKGEGRYRVKDLNVPAGLLEYEPVRADEEVSAHSAHETTCPALQRERERY